MPNPVFEVVRTVLAVREYQDKPVPDELMLRVVEAARLTAGAANRQAWHFILVRKREELRELGALVEHGPYIATAAAAVVVAYDKSWPFGVSDASRAIQSMVLTAWGEGVGSNWAGWVGMESVRKHVGLPTSYDVLAVVPFGYPKRALGKGRKRRKPLAEVASAERFGMPLS
ncbi:MAG TPA: nitroreductase family protein [Verrucomicrobiae bacterium]|nr:nitroreductase family protein [Verrucomicrobiae bacterium]